MLELPGHGWHGNVLRASGGGQWMILIWPPIYPWAVLDKPPADPDEECAVQRTWFEHAEQAGFEYYSPVVHPWALREFDEGCGTVDGLLRFAKERSLAVLTYTDLYEAHAARKTGGDGPTN